MNNLLIFSIINVIFILINLTDSQGRGRGPRERSEWDIPENPRPPRRGPPPERSEWDIPDSPRGPGRGRGRGPPPGRGHKNRQQQNLGVEVVEGDTLFGITLDIPQDTGVKPKPNKKPKPSRPNNPKPKPKPEVTVAVPEVSSNEWRLLERLKNHWANTAHTKSALSKKFIFWLDRDSDYSRHGACLTPEQELGHCHFVQHCPLPDVIKSFDTFLKYACFIRNRYVGICCPDDYLEAEETEDRPTTRRPQKPPKIPKPQSANSYDGSDYTNGVCGVAENPKIIGGALADPKEWIWMAALILKSATKPYCGGALISSQHILTAAHCLRELTPDDVTVRLGAYDFSGSADAEAQDFAIDYFKIHPKYNRITNENDLAIIKLMSKTQFTDSIRPICFPQKNRDYAGQLGVVTGWGHTSFGGSGSDQLRQVSLPVWNNTSCDAAFSVAITEFMLCAGNRKGGKDSCQGDSGGPLMLQGPNKRWMIIGVVSWGIKCGTPGYPGVYTRISKYIDWVKNNSKDV